MLILQKRKVIEMRHLQCGDRNLILKKVGDSLRPDFVAQRDILRQFAKESGVAMLGGCYINENAYDLVLRAAAAHNYSITVVEDE